ncbi:TPA: hypothetical protein ACOECL_000459 [Stenotrophomonas maltophilia]|uniref:hypothetical protein n=1 Tax=Stenotrophomonas maltophilia TaxID=40324 RepID=UPI000DAA384C|nr:hypothetical protein [Stenotrophomonas maltophilia]PZS70591.1 hypothetical protein A7X76_10285 [Stenotrophomonas maltophilia]
MSVHSDEAREERIKMLAALMRAAVVGGDRQEARRLHSEFKAAVFARSPEQNERMRRAVEIRVFGEPQ